MIPWIPQVLGRECMCVLTAPAHYLLLAAQPVPLVRASERRHAAGRSFKDALAMAQAATNKASLFFQQQPKEVLH